jgi:predicted transcriptional regulator
MTIQQLADKLDLVVFTASEGMGKKVEGGYVSDLLSDVMGHAQEGEVWITLQSHVNVVAIASLKELAAIVLVKGIEPDKAVIDKAVEEGIPILGTSEQTFVIAGKLFQLLNG